MARWVRVALRVAGPFGCRCPNIRPCPVSTSRSSNRTCGFAASGSPTGFTGRHTTARGAPFAHRYSSFRSRLTIDGVGRPCGQFLLALGYFHSVPEVRFLPSTGITRLQRYYEPLRLPKRPGLSLAGVRLAHAATTWGLPCCVDSPCTDMPAPLPRRDRRWDRVAPLTATTAAFPLCPQGRLPLHRFRGLLGVHSRSGLPARRVAETTLSIESSGSFVTSATAPIATGWSNTCQVGIAPTVERHLCTAHGHASFRIGGIHPFSHPKLAQNRSECPENGVKKHRTGNDVATTAITTGSPVQFVFTLLRVRTNAGGRRFHR